MFNKWEYLQVCWQDLGKPERNNDVFWEQQKLGTFYSTRSEGLGWEQLPDPRGVGPVERAVRGAVTFTCGQQPAPIGQTSLALLHLWNPYPCLWLEPVGNQREEDPFDAGHRGQRPRAQKVERQSEIQETVNICWINEWPLTTFLNG